MAQDEPDVVQYERFLLHKVRLYVAHAISPYVLRNARASSHYDYLTDRMIVALDSHVLGEVKDRVHTIVEKPVYLTWRHHLIGSLPLNSFRRRFLERLWGVDGPLGTQVTHTVTATARRVFPRNEMDYPKELGVAIEFAAIRDDYYERDYRDVD